MHNLITENYICFSPLVCPFPSEHDIHGPLTCALSLTLTLSTLGHLWMSLSHYICAMLIAGTSSSIS